MLELFFNGQMCADAIAEFPSLGGVYVVSLIVAGGLLVVSAFLGGHSHSDVDVEIDTGFDADVDMDVGAHADVDLDAAAHAEVGGLHTHAAGSALSLSTWISVRFVMYFAAMFGLVGTVLTHSSDVSPGSVLAYAVIGGFIMGQFAHQLFRYLKKNSSDSTTHVKDYVNKLGRVTVAIKPPSRGEVAIQVGENERCLPARAKRDDEVFEPGQSVGVIGFHFGTALIVSRREYDFLNESNEGGTT